MKTRFFSTNKLYAIILSYDTAECAAIFFYTLPVGRSSNNMLFIVIVCVFVSSRTGYENELLFDKITWRMLCISFVSAWWQHILHAQYSRYF